MRNQATTWGSHIPLNKAILDTFKITGVMELGSGLYSTSMFFKNSKNVISVETDQKWIEKVKEEIKETKNKRIVFQPTPKGITRSTRRNALTESQLAEARAFWLDLKTPKMNFLFIDCISSLRYEALIGIADQFDVVTFHDYQMAPGLPGIANHYNGQPFVPPETHKMFIDATYVTRTGLLIKNELCSNIDALRENHAKEVELHHKAEAKIIEA